MIKDIIKKQIRKTGMVKALELENEKLQINSQNRLTSLKNQINHSQNELTNLKNQINHSQNELTNLKNQINHLETDKLKVTEHQTLLEEKEKLCTVPNFEDLKLSLKGKDNYLFLVNDSNNEIRQHFDQSYVNNFNSSFFIENLKYKEEYCTANKTILNIIFSWSQTKVMFAETYYPSMLN